MQETLACLKITLYKIGSKFIEILHLPIKVLTKKFKPHHLPIAFYQLCMLWVEKYLSPYKNWIEIHWSKMMEFSSLTNKQSFITRQIPDNLTLKGYFLTLWMQIAKSVERNAYVRPPRHLLSSTGSRQTFQRRKHAWRIQANHSIILDPGHHSIMYNPGQPA